jgi:hypothetical protein
MLHVSPHLRPATQARNSITIQQIQTIFSIQKRTSGDTGAAKTASASMARAASTPASTVTGGLFAQHPPPARLWGGRYERCQDNGTRCGDDALLRTTGAASPDEPTQRAPRPTLPPPFRPRSASPTAAPCSSRCQRPCRRARFSAPRRGTA